MSDHKYIQNRYTLFLSKVDTQSYEHDKCWVWQGASKGNGYGNVRLGTKNITAHRYAYAIFVGDVPDDMDVCHTCDNRFCVNPDHLFLGSRKDNMMDCKEKGRAKGHYKIPFNEKLKQEAMRLLVNGNDIGIVARALETSRTNIRKVHQDLLNKQLISE